MWDLRRLQAVRFQRKFLLLAASSDQNFAVPTLFSTMSTEMFEQSISEAQLIELLEDYSQNTSSFKTWYEGWKNRKITRSQPLDISITSHKTVRRIVAMWKLEPGARNKPKQIVLKQDQKNAGKVWHEIEGYDCPWRPSRTIASPANQIYGLAVSKLHFLHKPKRETVFAHSFREQLQRNSWPTYTTDVIGENGHHIKRRGEPLRAEDAAKLITSDLRRRFYPVQLLHVRRFVKNQIAERIYVSY